MSDDERRATLCAGSPVEQKGPWEPSEIAFLRDNYLGLSYAEIGQVLGRSTNAVRSRCSILGLRKAAPNWTGEEVQRLVDFYGSHDGGPLDLSCLERLFPGRGRTNICRKARSLGLTDQSRSKSSEQIDRMRVNSRAWHRDHEHPRGFLGRKHSEKAKAVISAKARRMWRDQECYLNSDEYRQKVSDRMSNLQRMRMGMRNGYSRGRMGKRDDLDGLYVRSSWEANYARYLNWLVALGEIAGWEYESVSFCFEAIKRGTRSYTPDFTVHLNDGRVEYHEVKGWMDAKSRTKLKRMAKYHPDVKVVLIDAEAYKAIERSIRSFIPNWE